MVDRSRSRWRDSSRCVDLDDRSSFDRERRSDVSSLTFGVDSDLRGKTVVVYIALQA